MRGFEFKMFRLTSEATRRRKLFKHSSGLLLHFAVKSVTERSKHTQSLPLNIVNTSA